MSLWYVDRSRFEDGTQLCSWRRYLGYHFGPSGYGIARRAQSLPLATGTGAHHGGESLGRWAISHPEATSLPLEVIREASLAARAEYLLRARASGIYGVGDIDQLDYIIGEQAALIGGLIWCEGLEFWPYLLERYEVIAVETEETLVLDCSCGLGDRIGTAADHEARQCQGICFMSRPDLITRSRDRIDSHQYWERKTASYITGAWRDQWETKIQFHAGVVACEQRLGIRIDETYVVGLYKGQRRKNSKGEVLQGSCLCYGYELPAVPPMQAQKWEALWEDDERTPKQLSSKWRKRPIWLQAFDGMGNDPVEYWVRWLPPRIRQQQLAIAGPYNRQELLIEGFLRDLVPHERQWQQSLWNIYQALEQHDWEWSRPEVQAAIGQEIQRSWACRKFGAEHECPMKPLCFQHEGWQDPLGSERYILRRPHHVPELEMALAQGVIPPDEGDAEEEE